VSVAARALEETTLASLKSDTEAVRVRDVGRHFGTIPVLDGLSLDVAPGEFVALLGASGSGKTTLLRMLAGLDHPQTGQVDVVAERAVVFQEPRLVPWRKCWKNVALGLSGPDPRARAITALEEVGLGHRLDAWPRTLSGGEAQRAALARALVREPRLLLLDEPFASLDALTRLRMYDLLAQLWQQHRPAILLVTHDVNEATLLADRALVMSSGKIAAEINLPQARPRVEGDPALVADRVRLLKELGVQTPLGH